MKEESDSEFKIFLVNLATIFLLIWILVSIASMIMSIICLKHGINSESIVGVLLAFVPFISGPFYWIYYIWNNKYCQTPKNNNL